jgi:tetratricopeptide (TPR) repeat protein
MEEPSEELASLLRARQEIEELELQILREEERLHRIETELLQLRHQRAVLASAQSAFELGEELYTAGSVVWARDAFEAVISNFPESEYTDPSLFRLQLIAFELQDFEAALEYYEKLRASSPGFEYMEMSLIVAGLADYSLGQFSQARQKLARVNSSGPNGPLANYLSAVALVAEGDKHGAMVQLQSVVDNAGRQNAAIAERARIAIAQILVEEERFDDAIRQYNRVSPFSTYYDVAMLGKVWTLMRQEKYQEAYNLADRVLYEVPGTGMRSEFELAMANCALGAQDIEIAVARYRQLMNQYRRSEDVYDLFVDRGVEMSQQYQSERERLERMRLGLAELKEEAYLQGDMDLVAMIEAEERSIRNLFIEISSMEAALSMPASMDAESARQELNRLIASARANTEILSLSVKETVGAADSRGTEAERRGLERLEGEVSRIRLALQDLAGKMDSGMAGDHDWIQETQYGIAIATFIERELKRDSLNYLGAFYNARIEDAYASGDSARVASLSDQRRRETTAIQRRIDAKTVECATYFEEYLAMFPESRFTADILVRLAQLYYDIDKNTFLDRIAASGGEFIPMDFSRTIDLYQRVLSQYPESEVEDVALYSLGYALNEMGDPNGAIASYRRLLTQYPQSPLAAETYVRAGDHYFDSFVFDSALVYYDRVLDHPQTNSTVFQFGLYKLGWTNYLLNNYNKAVAIFAYLITDTENMEKLGLGSGSTMVEESIEYIAHSFMEQQRGSSVQMASGFLDSFDRPAVTVAVLDKMGAFYMEQGYWTEAIQAYSALLARAPYSADAPFIQARIAAAHEGAGDMLLAVQAREALVERYGSGGDWAEHMGDPQRFARVDSVRAAALEQAINYHLSTSAQIPEDQAGRTAHYRNLISRLKVYLEEYGERRVAYDYKFFLGDSYYAIGDFTSAGDAYMDVAHDRSSTLKQETALGNAFTSYFSAYSQGALPDSAALRESLRETATFYADNYPAGEYADQFLFASASSFYNAGEYSDARELYTRIYNEYPRSQYIARSARYVAASFEAQQLYGDAEQWYGRAADAASLSGEDLGEDFELLAASAAYRDAETLAASEDAGTLLAAAARFEESARSHPGTDVAPTALFDAGETYGKAGDIPNAIRVFTDLANRYPENPLAPQGFLRAAFLAREAKNYILAGDTYLEAFNRYPMAEGMASAIYSAALSYEEGGATDRAMSVYERIIRERSGSPEVLVISLGKYGDNLYDRMDYQGARQMYRDCIETYDNFRQGPAAHPARAAFRIGEITRRNYDAVTVTSTETAQAKTQLKTEVESWYAKSLTYNVDTWFMASCARAGELFEDYANSIAFMDPPPGLDDEAIDEFYSMLYIQIYEPNMQNAINVYTTAIQKAVSAGVMNDWVDRAATNLELLAPGSVAALGLPGYGYAEEPLIDPGTTETGDVQ